MDAVNNYTSSIGLAYTQNTLNTIGSIKESKKEQTEDNKIAVSTTDSVKINETNANIINTKKAYDAFNETEKQYEKGEEQFPPAYYFIMFKSMMEDSGVSVPDFKLDGENPENTNFIGFTDKLKDFAKSLSINDSQFSSLPRNFFEFCDTYKENLIKNGCQ